MIIIVLKNLGFICCWCWCKCSLSFFSYLKYIIRLIINTLLLYFKKKVQLKKALLLILLILTNIVFKIQYIFDIRINQRNYHKLVMLVKLIKKFYVCVFI